MSLFLFIIPFQAKASGKKPQKVALKISPQGVMVFDRSTNKLLENVSIYRCVQGSTGFPQSKSVCDLSGSWFNHSGFFLLDLLHLGCRISYCTVDKLHHKVFAYIAQNTLNGTLECYAYLCSKRKVVSWIYSV